MYGFYEACINMFVLTLHFCVNIHSSFSGLVIKPGTEMGNETKQNEIGLKGSQY